MMKNEAQAHAAFTKARFEQEKLVQAQPDNGPPLSVLGLMDALWDEKKRRCGKGGELSNFFPWRKTQSKAVNCWSILP